MKTDYGSAVLGPQAHAIDGVDEDMDGLFDFVGDAAKAVGKAVGGAAQAVAHAASGAVEAVDKAYVAATPQWFRKAVGAAVGPAKLVWDSADNLAHGQRIDRALLDAAQNQAAIFKAAAPFAQMGLSFIPGVGQGISAAIGAGLALAEGKRITDALIAGVKGAIPGGPVVQQAVDLGVKAAVDLASGKRLDEIALAAVRDHLPGGEAAKIAFDTGLALAQGKKIQDAGLAAAAHFVPNNPLAQGAFEMTKRALSGQPLSGSGHAAMQRFAAPPPPPPRPRFAPLPHAVARKPVMQFARRSVHMPAPRPVAHAPVTPASLATSAPHTSHALPIALGVAALAAAGGGAWWWWKQHEQENQR